jgi:hypothetical protein
LKKHSHVIVVVYPNELREYAGALAEMFKCKVPDIPMDVKAWTGWLFKLRWPPKIIAIYDQPVGA